MTFTLTSVSLSSIFVALQTHDSYTPSGLRSWAQPDRCVHGSVRARNVSPALSTLTHVYQDHNNLDIPIPARLAAR